MQQFHAARYFLTAVACVAMSYLGLAIKALAWIQLNNCLNPDLLPMANNVLLFGTVWHVGFTAVAVGYGVRTAIEIVRKEGMRH